MELEVTLRYLTKTVVEVKSREQVPEGCTAGELAAAVLQKHESERGIHFTGASIAVLVNGKLAADKTPLQDGDEMKILPVAAGG